MRPDATTLAEQTRKQLIEDAGLTISILQDSVDLGMASEKEVEQLRVWKTYRIRLSRVSTANAPDIEWPVVPVAGNVLD
ncbi:hypothetical protein BFV65_15850 [Enterobacter hormaechei subsp. hoffmannii]|nr:hypothetical protein BFV65_15850 [Enterobacter hormaechei subsp. hoffmannii]